MKIEYGMSPSRKESYLNEQQRKSKYAPRIKCKGPYIKDCEELSRSCFYPDHTNPDGTLRVEGISRKDLTDRGFSVDRIKYTPKAIIEKVIADYLARNSARSFKYILAFDSRAVRSVIDIDGYQAFIIVDDAPIRDLKGHAVIRCAGVHKPSQVKELRELLAGIINYPKPVSEVYP